jgi:two-component system, sensor histidine kinase and response regulator
VTEQHRLLRRQLHRAGLAEGDTPTAEQWAAFVSQVDEAYAVADRDRAALSGSLQQVSGEMQGLYEKLRRAKDSELAAERDKLSAILTSMGDGLVSVDAAGRVLTMNPAGRAMLATRAEAVAGESLLSLLDAPGEAEGIEAALAERRPWRVRDGRMRRADGQHVPVSAVLTPVQSRCETAAVLLFHDIREQKAAALALERARAEAEAHSRLKSAFLANMSHEIRTPMNAVIGMTGLLLDSPLAPQQQEYAEIVRSSGRHLLSLINSILDFSKIEAGKLEIERIDFDLRGILDDVLELFSETAAGKGVELVGHMPTGVSRWRLGDPGRIRQVLINLVSNALKFTEAGEVVVSVAREGGSGDGALRFSVRDSGIGISAEQATTLFDPFVQADGGTTRRYGGTGLGLAICRQLAELMGGQIGVRSEVGRGSTFWFTAALAVGAAGEAAPIPAGLAGQRVLVVDDSAASRHVVSDLMRGFGATVSCAGAGMEALAMVHARLAAGERFDLVLLDADMPGLAGIDLARALRADPRTAAWTLALMTRLGHAVDGDALRNLEIAGCLSKPVRRDAAACHIAAMLDPSPVVESVASPAAPSEPLAPGPRVLVAEDTPVNQLLARRMLERLGVAHDIVDNGREAVEAAATGRYAMVLMDCMMPEMDGYSATRAIRRAEVGTGRRLPVVAMTANALSGSREDCLDAGMDDYLSKPVEPAVLDAMVRKWFRVAAQAPGEPDVSAPEPDAAPDEPELAVLRWDVLEQFTGSGDPDAVEELVAIFLEDAAVRVGELQAAAAARDASAARLAAHALKSGCGYLGAEALADACSQVEAAGRADDRAALVGLVEALCEQHIRLCAAVPARRAS